MPRAGTQGALRCLKYGRSRLDTECHQTMEPLVAKTVINAPADEVFEWLVDDDKLSRWCTDLVSRQSDDAVVFAHSGRTMLGKRRTTQVERPVALTVVEEDAIATHEIEFKLSDQDGATEVVRTVRTTASPIWLGIMKRISIVLQEEANAAALEDLKKLVESNPTSAHARQHAFKRSYVGDGCLRWTRKYSAEAKAWKSLSRSARWQIARHALSGTVATNRSQASLVAGFADSKRNLLRLNLSLLAPFTAFAWLLTVTIAAQGHIAAALIAAGFSSFYTACLLMGRYSLKALKGARNGNNAYLKYVDHVEGSLQSIDSPNEEVRLSAIDALRETQVIGPLNFRIEAALARESNSARAGREEAGHALEVRRALAAAVAR